MISQLNRGRLDIITCLCYFTNHIAELTFRAYAFYILYMEKIDLFTAYTILIYFILLLLIAFIIKFTHNTLILLYSNANCSNNACLLKTF